MKSRGMPRLFCILQVIKVRKNNQTTLIIKKYCMYASCLLQYFLLLVKHIASS